MVRYHYFKTEAEARSFDLFCKAVGKLTYYVGRVGCNGDEYEVREIV